MGMLTEEKSDEVISRFCLAAAGLEDWGDVLRFGSQATNSSCAHMFGIGTMFGDSSLHSSWNMPDSYWLEYVAYYHKLDIWAASAGQLLGGVSRAADDDRLLGRHVHEEWLNSEIYSEWAWRFGTAHFCVFEDRNLSFGSAGGGLRLGFYRDVKRGWYDDAETRLMRRLLRVVPASIGLTQGKLLRSEADRASTKWLEQASDMVIWIDQNLCVLNVNESGRRQLKILGLASSAGPKVHLDGALRHCMQAHVASAAGANGAFSSFVIPVRGRKQLVAFVHPVAVPIRPLLNVPGCSWILVIRDMDAARGQISWQTVSEAFELTPAETRLAACLMEEIGLSGAAARLGVSLETVRSQMKALFRKTGTASQAEFLGLIARVFSTDLQF